MSDRDLILKLEAQLKSEAMINDKAMFRIKELEEKVSELQGIVVQLMHDYEEALNNV